jgi:DNA-directed RNA polymerase subunit beta
VIGAIIAEDIELAGEATAADAPKLKTKKARAERERNENVLLVKEGDELTEEVLNRLRRLNIDTVKVFASLSDATTVRSGLRSSAARAKSLSP